MTVSLGYALFVLAVYVLAVMRLVRLINLDAVLDRPRIWLVAHSGRRRDTVEYFIGCPWCVGMWLAFATAWLPVLLVGLPLWWWVLIALATSHLVGVCAGLWTDEDMQIEDVEV